MCPMIVYVSDCMNGRTLTVNVNGHKSEKATINNYFSQLLLPSLVEETKVPRKSSSEKNAIRPTIMMMMRWEYCLILLKSFESIICNKKLEMQQ